MTDPELERQVQDLLAAQDAAWSAGDADGHAALAAPEIAFTNILGLFGTGVEAHRSQHAHILSTVYRGSRLRQAPVHVTPAGEGVAVVGSLTALTGFERLPPGVAAIDGALRTRMQQVLVRRDGAWRVLAAHNVAVQPAVAPARL